MTGARIIEIDPDDPHHDAVAAASAVLQRGGVIVYPTETLYGLGCDALDPSAVKRVYELKGRDSRKPISILVHDMDLLRECVATLPDAAQRLAKEFWPGPLTMVLPASKKIPRHLTAGKRTVGIRIPGSPFCLALLQEFGGAVTATSANLSGGEEPTTLPELQALFADKVPLIVYGGHPDRRKPSTVVDVSSGRAKLLRPGAIPLSKIRDVLDDIAPKPR